MGRVGERLFGIIAVMNELTCRKICPNRSFGESCIRSLLVQALAADGVGRLLLYGN